MARPVITVEEIKQLNERQGINNSVRGFFDGIEELKEAFSLQNGPEFGQFVIIRLATISEVFTRTAIKEIVNSDLTKLENFTGEVSSIRVGLDHLTAMQNTEISVGDLVARSYALNRWEQYVAAFQSAFPGYPDDIVNICDPFHISTDGSERRPIIDDWDDLSKQMSSLFEARHVLVHELPEELPHAVEKAEDIANATERWISATSEFVSVQLYGPTPVTQVEITEVAAKSMEKWSDKVDELVNKISKLDNSAAKNIVEVQKAWENATTMEANMIADQYIGGSIYNTVWSGHYEQLLTARVDQLESLYSELSQEF